MFAFCSELVQDVCRCHLHSHRRSGRCASELVAWLWRCLLLASV